MLLFAFNKSQLGRDRKNESTASSLNLSTMDPPSEQLRHNKSGLVEYSHGSDLFVHFSGCFFLHFFAFSEFFSLFVFCLLPYPEWKP